MGKTRYRALLIGNARFEKDPHNLPALKGPPEDLKILERALTADGTGIHEAADVKTLLDGTKPELSEAIDDFFQTAGAGDQLLLYYSGHGRQDAYNNLYLCARDTRTDRLNSSAVADSEISQMIRNSRAARTVIVLDCCHSGSFKGGGMPEALANAGGRFLLTSCRDQQLATDAGETGGASAFTSHLVQALIAGEVDANEDGYVTLTEVYHHILPKLKIATQQIPQLHFDKTVGDPPLGKVVAKKAEATVVGTGMVVGASEVAARPVLAVSDSKIELHDVHVGEQLPPVTIDVFNEGGGELDWTATSEEGWIAIEAGKRFFKVSFTPKKAGAHRGNIYVRDAGRGGSRRISVFLDVLEPVAKPVLLVETQALDFGKLRVGARGAPQVIRVANRGSGELAIRAHSTNPALKVTANDDAIAVEPDLSRAGSLAGEIVIASAGGRAVVKVSGEAEAGPLLVVKPGKVLDFGEVPVDAYAVLTIQVENGGSDYLEWSCRTEGDFFGVQNGDAPNTIKVSVGGQRPPGPCIGSIFIKSNGGDATVNVRAQFVAPVQPPLPPMPPQFVPSLAGWWQNPNGRILVSGQGPVYQYTDYNAFGMQIGGGTITVNGAQVYMQGSSLLIPYTAQLLIQGMMMSGTVMCLGTQNPVVYTRV
jgi:hypothetical protein